VVTGSDVSEKCTASIFRVSELIQADDEIGGGGDNSVRYIGRSESAWPITATEGGKRGSFGTESMRIFRIQ
jgi:hypothetical protein